LKILFINTEREWSEYSEQELLLASSLKKLGHQVFVALDSKSQLNKQAWMRRLQILSIKSIHELNPLAIYKLSKFIKKNNIELMHIYNDKVIPLAIYAAKIAGLRSLIITHHSGFPPKVGFFLRRFYLSNRLYVISTSKYIKEALFAQQIEPKESYILPEGVDLVRYQDTLPFYPFYQEFSIPPEFFLIGCQGPGSNIIDAKFLLEIVEGVCQTKPNVIFLIIGSVQNRRLLKPLFQEKNLLNKLIMIGQRDDLPNILSALNMLIAPFNRKDYRCLILKAMAMAKPVITWQYQGIDEIIQQGKNGIILSNEDSATLAAAIVKLAGEKKKLKLLGANARKRVEKFYNIKLLAARLENIYLNILRGIE